MDFNEQEYRMAKAALPNFDFEPLLELKGNENIRNVFIQVAKGRLAEMTLIKQRLSEIINCEVLMSSKEGDWNSLKRCDTALVIIHPSENFRGTLPGLQQLLTQGSGVKVWSVGVQHSLCIMEDRDPAYEAQRLFPSGGMTFITDDVFIYYPEKAAQIIQKVCNAAKQKLEDGEYSLIGARPGIKDWMQELVIKKWVEDDRPDEQKDRSWLICHDILDQLCLIDDEDTHLLSEWSVPFERAWLWSTDAVNMPGLQGKWENGDEEGTTDYIVEHFAGEARISAPTLRRWIVVHQRPVQATMGQDWKSVDVIVGHEDPRGWTKKYSHIGVMSADQYLTI